MKSVALLAALVCLSSIAGASEVWENDLSTATARAAREKKMVLVNFTGSDWCPPCKMMDEQTLSQKKFLEFAEKHLVLVALDFTPYGAKPSKFQKTNDALANEYGINAFPTFILLNSQGKMVAKKMGFVPGGPKAFIDWIEKAPQTVQ